MAEPTSQRNLHSGLTFSAYKAHVPRLVTAYHLVGPLLVLSLCWLQCLRPDLTAAWNSNAPTSSSSHWLRLPSVLHLGVVRHWTAQLPLHALNRTQAWELGAAEARISELLTAKAAGIEHLDSLLELAVRNGEHLLLGAEATASPAGDHHSALGGDPGVFGDAKDAAMHAPMTKAQQVLHRLREAKQATYLLELEAGAASFLSRAFSLINIVWFIATIGIVVSIGPLAASIVGGLVSVALWLWRTILSHLWRPALFAFASGTFLSATDASISIDVRVYVCLLFALLVWLALIVTLSQLVDAKLLASSGDYHLIFLYLFLLLSPLACSSVLNSQLLGFISIMALFASFGCGMGPIPGIGYWIGFNGRSALNRCLLLSFTLLAVTIAASASTSHPVLLRQLQPFSTGLQCFGATAFYLGMLIKADPFTAALRSTSSSSSNTGADSSSSRHSPMCSPLAISILVMVTSLTAGIAVGTLLPMPSLANTALVFLYLWSLDVVTYLAATSGNVWLAVFVGSSILSGIAYHLHLHPEMVVSLYTYTLH